MNKPSFKRSHQWGLGALALLGGLWLVRERPEPVAAPTKSAAGSSKPWKEGPLVTRTRGDVTTTRQSPRLEDRIAIESVEVSKTEVCRGEEVTVSVKAKSLDDEDAELTYGVQGYPQLFGPLFTMRPQESIGLDWMKVFVRGRLGTHEPASIPPVLVKECEEQLQLRVEQIRDADQPDRATLIANVDVKGGEAFVPVSFDWDLGDGSREQTSDARIRHSYEGRPRTTSQSYFFVSVTARDAQGRSAKGSRSLRFVNLGYRDFRDHKRVTVFAGFESAESGGERTWLYHGAPVPVTLDSVAVSDLQVDAEGHERHLNRREQSASAALGVTELPAGRSVSTRDLESLRPREPGTMRLVEVRGHGPGSATAEGAFVLRGPSLPEPPETAMTLPELPAELGTPQEMEGIDDYSED